MDCEFIADTSELIPLLRGGTSVSRTLENRQFATTYVTYAELVVGLLGARDPAVARKELGLLLADVEVHFADQGTLPTYAEVFHDLRKR